MKNDFDIDNPPAGAWITKEPDALILGATTRSGTVLFLIPFIGVLEWALKEIYVSYLSREGGAFIIYIVSFFFIMGLFILMGVSLMFILGKVELTVNDSEGKVFTGIGKVGLTKRFQMDEIISVRDTKVRGEKGSSTRSKLILLEKQKSVVDDQKNILFGSLLSDKRSDYILYSLQKILSDYKNRTYTKNDDNNSEETDLSDSLID